MKQTPVTRLLRLEQQVQLQPGGFELWLDGDAGEMIGPHGEIITVEEFERRYPDAIDLSADATGGACDMEE